MKKILLPIVCAGFLAACTQPEETGKKDVSSETETGTEFEAYEVLTIDPDDIRFVAGWLDDRRIAYVDHEESDRLRSFDIETGDMRTLYDDPSTISEVRIHAGGDRILVKTGDDRTEAVIHLLDYDGMIQNEIFVESSELEIDWDDNDASQLLITAFTEDWQYDVMHYDANDDTLQAVEVPDPFVRWLGTGELVYMLDGSLIKQSLATGDTRTLASDINQYAVDSAHAVIEIFEEQHTRYSVLDARGKELDTWLSEDGAFMMEQAAYLGKGRIALTMTDQQSPSVLVEMQDGHEVRRLELANGGQLNCRDNKCLTGYSFDAWIDMESGETVNWMIESGV